VTDTAGGCLAAYEHGRADARRRRRDPAGTGRPLTLVVAASAATVLCLAEGGFDL